MFLSKRKDITFALTCYYDLGKSVELVPGGLFNQSGLWLKIVRTIRNEIAGYDKERYDKARRKK